MSNSSRKAKINLAFNRKIKSSFCLLLFIQIFHCTSAFGQVASIANLYLEPNVTLLIGPKNVDKHFIGQSDIYLDELLDFQYVLKGVLEEMKNQLEGKAERTIRCDLKEELERTTIQLDIVANHIFYWEEHKLNYERWNEEMGSSLDNLDCLLFDIEGGIYTAKDIELLEFQENKTIEYNEFVNDEFEVVYTKFNEKYMEEKMNKKNTSFDSPKQEEFLPMSSHTITVSYLLNYFTRIAAGDDIQALERMDKYAEGFEYDPNAIEFVRKVSATIISKSYCVILQDDPTRTSKINTFSNNCNE